MLKIRLMRIGAKKQPFYRVVLVDERAKRTGAYIELLGTYNPLTKPKDIKLKQDRIDHWIKQGAQPSTGYLRIIGKAPQRPPRKPKKASKSEGPEKPEVQETSEPVKEIAETPVEATVSEEAKPSEPEAVESTPKEDTQPEEQNKPEESETKNEGSA